MTRPLITVHTALSAVLLAMLALTPPVMAQAAGKAVVAPATELKDCVIQEVLPGKDMTGAYLRIVRQGAPVQISRADIPSLSARVELHSMEVKNGVMQMREMTELTVNPGERVFQKGGDHVMLFDIAQKPAIGSRHTLTLHFSDNTQASCQAEVKSFKELMQGGSKASGNTHDHHGHKH